MLRLATALWYLGNEGIKEAKGVLNKLLRHDPRNIEARILLAFTYKLLKKFKDAEILFRLTIEQLPADSRAYWTFGYFLASDLKDSAEADFYFQKAIELDPQSGAAHYYYGRSLLNAGREEKGKRHIEKAAELGFDKAQTCLESLREAAVKD
jgi:Tfp pilus assembly protein PilF